MTRPRPHRFGLTVTTPAQNLPSELEHTDPSSVGFPEGGAIYEKNVSGDLCGGLSHLLGVVPSYREGRVQAQSVACKMRSLEARGGIEPPIKVLQTFALPLGDRASDPNLTVQASAQVSPFPPLTAMPGFQFPREGQPNPHNFVSPQQLQAKLYLP